jgi:tyrosine-protein kinase Etk/Wzc
MQQPYELSLRDYWGIILKRKWIILLFCLAVIVVTAIGTNFQPKLYRATALISVDQAMDSSQIFNYEPRYWMPSELPDYVQQIASPSILESAMKQLGLITEDKSKPEMPRAQEGAYGHISAKEIEHTNMLRVEFVSNDAGNVALITNKVIEVFKQEVAKRKSQRVRNVREFIEKQITRVSSQLEGSQEKLKALTMKGVGNMANSMEDKISQLESKRVDLATKFTDIHPEIKMINDQIAELKEQMNSLPPEEFEYSKVKSDIALNEKLYTLLRERLQEAQIKESENIDNIHVVSPAKAPREPFSPNKPWNYAMGIVLGMVFGVFVGLLLENLDTSIGKIDDLESITGISVVGVIPFCVSKNKETRDSNWQRLVGIFNLRSGREERMGKLKDQLITMHSGGSIFLEAFRILGANAQVIFGDGNKIKRKSILITSANPQEGKTLIAANLGIVMAQIGYKTVVIDADLRRSSLHRIFGIKKNKGVTDVLSGTASLNSVVRTITDLLLGDVCRDEIFKNPWLDNFHLITSGTTFPNSPYLLNTENMNIMLKELKEKFDVVIFDSSPALAVSDTSILVPKMDGVLVVYRSGATSRMALHRTKVQVESAASGKGAIKGIILNNVTPEASADTYYYYHKNKYYSQENSTTKAGV